MQKEEKLIPFKTEDLTGNRVLALIPHPDDETIGCGGSLALHAEAKDPVKIVIMTDGSQGGDDTCDRDGLIAQRKSEARLACGCLGVDDIEFWGYADRRLAGAPGALRRLIKLLEQYRPSLIYAPSPLEFHPDHRACCYLLNDALRSFVPDCHIAFYEINQPMRVNRLVDIDPVLDKKKRALAVYDSQIMQRPYDAFTLGLNRYRSMTLAPRVTYAEGYTVWPSHVVRQAGVLGLPWFSWQALAPSGDEAGPLVSVILLCQNRSDLLVDALNAIGRQSYANLEIILVNLGTQNVEQTARALLGDVPLTYLGLDPPASRSIAINAGLEAACGSHFNVIEENDLIHPDHIKILVNEMLLHNTEVVYADIVHTYYSAHPSIAGQPQSKDEASSHEFDANRLLTENYLAFASVLFSQSALAEVGRFCERLKLFEDWDFWIRLSRHCEFKHVKQTTAEKRILGQNQSVPEDHNTSVRDEARAIMNERLLPLLSPQERAVYLGHSHHQPISLDDLQCELDRLEVQRRILRRKIEENQHNLQQRQQHWALRMLQRLKNRW